MLSKNEKSKVLLGNWKNIELYFVCTLRINKHGEKTIVFLVSNIKAAARDYVIEYDKRWIIEVMIRTSKQKLGISECQARDINKQKAHIYAVFLSYACLAKKALHSKEKSTDIFINELREENTNWLYYTKRLTDQIFVGFA